jgi:hypothetical protein
MRVSMVRRYSAAIAFFFFFPYARYGALRHWSIVIIPAFEYPGRVLSDNCAIVRESAQAQDHVSAK